MTRSQPNLVVALLIPVALVLLGAKLSGGASLPLSQPAAAPLVDASPTLAGEDTAVFAGGCFWGVEAVFDHVKGVKRAISGYAGGNVSGPSYEQVSTGDTGHAESVEVIYDPSQVSYGKLLQIFFSVAHDPTEINRQGPDFGTQYRSMIFPANAEQASVAKAYITQLDQAHVFRKAIATRVEGGRPFYPAENYHQDFLTRNPTYPYIVINDLPKIEDLKRVVPEFYRAAPVLVAGVQSSK